MAYGRRQALCLGGCGRMAFGFRCMKCQYPRRRIGSNGYVQIRKPDHPHAMAFGYVYEHRLVAEEKLGRPLLPSERVHHINEIKTDNRPENIEICSSDREHLFRHRKYDRGFQRPNEPNYRIYCACGCGQELMKFSKRGYPRRYLRDHNPRKT